MTTTLTQASTQWISRPADERFLSLLDMQAFKRAQRERSHPKVISSRKLGVEPASLIGAETRHGLIIRDESGYHSTPTHWSFGQLCSLASPGNSPASYFRETRMAAAVVADCLNYNLRFNRSIEDVGLYLYEEEDGLFGLRSVNGPGYGRVYDADVIDALVERFGDGITGRFRVPGEFGRQVTVTKANTTLYASDRDMFVFLADEENRVPVKTAASPAAFSCGTRRSARRRSAPAFSSSTMSAATASSGAQTSTPRCASATPRGHRIGGSKRWYPS
jgi:hypothetical protein